MRFNQPAWADMKGTMKAMALQAQWEQFLVGHPDPAPAVASALQPLAVSASTDQPSLSRSAARYAERKVAQKQYVTHENGGSKFHCKGTTLNEDVHRTPDGMVFRQPQALDPVHRQAIFEQTGVRYTGEGKLGQGANGEVRVAEVIGPDGRRGEIVASKTATGRQRASLRREAMMIQRLPHAPMFPEIRTAYLGKSHVIVLQELALGGTSGALHRQIEHAGNLTPAEKHRCHATLAHRYIQGMALMHERGLFHGDVKQANVLILKRPGQATRPIFIDYGLTLSPDPGSAVARMQQGFDRRTLAKMLGEVLPASGVWQDLARQVANPTRPFSAILQHEGLQSSMDDVAFTAMVNRL